MAGMEKANRPVRKAEIARALRPFSASSSVCTFIVRMQKIASGHVVRAHSRHTIQESKSSPKIHCTAQSEAVENRAFDMPLPEDDCGGSRIVPLATGI
jgi:hypothetical protein